MVQRGNYENQLNAIRCRAPSRRSIGQINYTLVVRAPGLLFFTGPNDWFSCRAPLGGRKHMSNTQGKQRV